MNLNINIKNLTPSLTTKPKYEITDEEREAIKKLSNYINNLQDFSFVDSPTGNSIIQIKINENLLTIDIDDNYINKKD